MLKFYVIVFVMFYKHQTQALLFFYQQNLGSNPGRDPFFLEQGPVPYETFLVSLPGIR